MTGERQSKRADGNTDEDDGGSIASVAARPHKTIPLAPGLYLAATPIGTAGDISLRVLDALHEADIIAAEDTRRTQTLMSLHGISRIGKRLIPYHDHNGASQRPYLIEAIKAGKSVVCVSDAGTPLIADPGWRLAREAIDAGVTIQALPGASALLAALSVAGLPTDRFFFAGFLPPKSGARQAELTALAHIPSTMVFYESPRRLGALLGDMRDVLGADRQGAVSRELTKKHEETQRGSLTDLAKMYADEVPRGEIVVCVGPPLATETTSEDLDKALHEVLATERIGDAARIVSQKLGLPKRDVYNRAIVLKEGDVR